ncbi:MAG TPA: hypothetical protein VJZ00_20520 [Thermoanaerobaculia bacterium]|nr:hypothetical protein [Thermoanaerobaculia bacterium]
MVGARFLLLTLAIPLFGLWLRPRAARIPVWFAAGLVTIAAQMFAISALGGRWAWWMLVPVPLALLVASLKVAKSQSLKGAVVASSLRLADFATLRLLLPVAVLVTMILAGAATSGDYVFFWGVKGQRFGQQHLLDTAFTKEPSHYMHPDYPPLVPLYYAWTMTGGTGAFDWWGGMLSSALFLTLSAFAIWSFGRYARVRTIDELAFFFASLYALFYIRNAVAGNAEPALNFFETIALAALTCWRERPDEHDVVAAIALSGVALTKVEGGVFVLLVVGVTCLVRRTFWRMGAIPLATLATWLIFGKLKGLTDTYIPRDDLSLLYLGHTAFELVKELSLHLWYVPWIVLAILLFTGRAKAALPYLAASLAFLVFLLLVYTRKEPHLEWSAGRTLMTPFLLAFFGVIAARRPSALEPGS